jgi:hypothetical protein
MSPERFLCALHERYDWILPATLGRKPPSDFPESADTLTPQEAKWRDRYHFLMGHGLELRPRYRPGWIPSWLGTNLHEWECEDGVVAVVSRLARFQLFQGRHLCHSKICSFRFYSMPLM